jgi:PAS domain S-box-containing protein
MAKDAHRTREQFLSELAELRQRVAELQTAEAVHQQTEEQLRESAATSEQILRSLVEYSHAGILILDDAYHLTYVNDELCRALGYSREEVIGSDFRRFLDDESKHDAADYYVRRQRGEKIPNRYELNIIRKDGEKRRVEISATVIRDPADNVQTVAQFVDITWSRQAKKEARERTAQLEALRRVGLELTAKLDLDALLRSIVSQAIELLGGTSGGLDLYRPERDLLEWTAAIGPNMAPVGAIIHRGEGLSGKIWETGEPLIVDDYQHWEGRAASWERVPVAAIVGAPVRWSGEFLGTLIVHADPPRTFSPADAELLSLFATQAAIAIRNARLYEAERKRGTQLAVVNQVARKIVSVLDTDLLLQEIVSAIQQGFGYGNVALFLLNEATCDLEMQAIAGDFEKTASPRYCQALGTGIVGWTAETGQPLLANDVSQEPRYIAGFLEETLTQSELCVPLKLAGQIIGVLDIQDTHLHAFDATDLTAMETLTDQIAAAIENAQLVASLAQEKERLELLHRLGQHLSESLDVHDVAQRALDDICTVMGAPRGILFVHQPKSDSLRLAAVSGYDEESLEALDRRLDLRLGQGLAGWVALHQQPSMVKDVHSDPRWLSVSGMDDWVGSVLSVPLLAGDELVGVLSIYSEHEAYFNEALRQLAESAAATVAAAVANARLFAEEQRRRQEAETLRGAALALTNTLDRNEVVERILAQLQEVVPYDTASVQLLREDRMEIVGGRGFPNLPDLLGVSFPLDDGNPNSEVVRTRASFIVDNAPATYTDSLREPHAQAGIRSWLGVPMLVGEQLVGMIALDKHEPQFYTQAHARMAEAFAAQAAVAVENSRLFQAEREQRKLSEALTEAAAAVTSTLEIEEVLDRILEQVEVVVPGDTFNIMLLEGDIARRVRWRGYKYMDIPDDVLGASIPIADYPSLAAMRNGNGPVVISDTANDMKWIPSAGEEWRRSYVAAPIRAGGTAVGILNVASIQPGQFGPADARRLETFANHAAAALENARLFQETSHRLAQTEVLRETMLAAASTLDFDQVLDRTIEVLEHAMGLEYLGFMLPEKDGTVMVSHPSMLGFTPPSGSVFRFPAGQCATGHVYRTGQPLILPDVRQAAVYRVADENVRSELAVPVRIGHEVIAVLNLESSQLDAFDKEDLAFYTAIAGQLGVAMENAQLYQQLRDYAQSLEERVQERTSEIQDQYARLDAILRGVSDGIIVCDGKGEILSANPVAQAWLFQTLSPEEARLLRAAVRDLAVRAEERPQAIPELTGLDLELRAALVEEHGSVEGPTVVVAAHDISHLQALDRMKTRFVSNVSHELRTPVTTIKLYAALMQRNPDKWKEYLEPLAQEADRQARLVEDILQISSIDTGRLEMNPVPCEINKLAEQAIASHRALARDKHIALRYRPMQPAPIALVDLERIMQVLNNLIENAINYTPAGGKVIMSTSQSASEGRTWATFSVTDTGIGIPEEELPRVFDRFFRGEEPQLMQLPGTGLGLAIVREIVELHGGRVTVESQVSVGTTFTICLPLAS